MDKNPAFLKFISRFGFYLEEKLKYKVKMDFYSNIKFQSRLLFG